MKILALDSSAVTASVAIVDDEKIIGESFVNAKLTHSTTLMPMVVSLLECTQTKLSEIDYFAVSSGPGSFTGLRIGIAAIKGMAMAEEKPCVGVSTLEAMAYNLLIKNAIVCSVMDARCSQFYNAIFEVKNGIVKRCCEDRALSVEELKNDLLKNYINKDIILVGDGAKIAYSIYKDNIDNVKIAPELLRYQHASGVAYSAKKKISKDEILSANDLLPTYLRLPQAQRELKNKALKKQG